jgi:ABC-type transport system involved in multi-copper enzyme maturation permease subunit
MRWLLIKDLQILRRSPLLVALLVLYPVVVALLIGFSFSRGPERPRVAIVNEVPDDQSLTIGGRRVDLLSAKSEVFERVDAIEVASRSEAIDKVRSGEALGALIVPRDTVQKLESQLERPRVQVFVNEEDPLKRRLVDDSISSLLAEANQRLSRAFTRVNLSYLDLLLRGGNLSFFGREFSVLGLENVERIARAARARLPRASRERRELGRVVRFSELAQQSLDLTDDVLAAVGEPIRAEKTVLSGSTVPLTTFAAAVAVALSLMFVTVLLAAGSLALERSENAFERLVRGPLTQSRLLAEKIVLAVGCSAAVTLVMLLGLGIFVPLEWERFALWVAALIVAAAAFAALGTAIGGFARDVSVASLLAFTLLLPVAFLALVPSGVVSAAVYDLTRVVSALFPFRSTVHVMSSVLYREGELVVPLLHLAALAVVFAACSRLALRRFAD